MRVAAAIKEIRSLFGETQQKFSERLGVALATVGRWEIGNRHPSPRYLQELWGLAIEHNRADLVKSLADAFTRSTGRSLHPDVGSTIRKALAELRHEATGLLRSPDDVAAHGCAKRILALCDLFEAASKVTHNNWR